MNKAIKFKAMNKYNLLRSMMRTCYSLLIKIKKYKNK